MNKVTTFEEFRIKTMLDLLDHVAEQVRSGKAKGLLVTVKLGERQHGIGLLGDYLDDPAQVLPVASRIDYRCNQLIDERLRKRTRGKVVPFGNSD